MPKRDNAGKRRDLMTERKENPSWDDFKREEPHSAGGADFNKEKEEKHRLIQSEVLKGFSVPGSIPSETIEWNESSTIPTDKGDGLGVKLVSSTSTGTVSYDPYIWRERFQEWRRMMPWNATFHDLTVGTLTATVVDSDVGTFGTGSGQSLLVDGALAVGSGTGTIDYLLNRREGDLYSSNDIVAEDDLRVVDDISFGGDLLRQYSGGAATALYHTLYPKTTFDGGSNTWSPPTGDARYTGRTIEVLWRFSNSDELNAQHVLKFRWDGTMWRAIEFVVGRGDHGFLGGTTITTTSTTISGSDCRLPSTGTYSIMGMMWGASRSTNQTDYNAIEVHPYFNGSNVQGNFGAAMYDEQSYVYNSNHHFFFTSTNVGTFGGTGFYMRARAGGSAGADGPYNVMGLAVPIRLDA